MGPCKPVNGLEQADLRFEQTSDFSWLLWSSEIAFCETTSGNLSHVMSRTFDPKSLVSMDSSSLRHICFFGLRSVAFWNLNPIHLVDDNLIDQKCTYRIFMIVETVTKAYPSLSMEWVRFCHNSQKKCGTEKIWNFPLRNNQETARIRIFKISLATERSRTRLDPYFFKIHKSPCCRPFKDLHGPMPIWHTISADYGHSTKLESSFDVLSSL